MTTTQIEDAVRTFCVLATREGIEVTGDVTCHVLGADGAYWRASLFGHDPDSSDVAVVACNIQGKSPGIALLNAHSEYMAHLDAYLAEQAEEVAG